MNDLQVNLSFIYRLIVASERLLERAIEKSDGELREYFNKHYEEELGHAEMLAADLARLGVNSIPRFHLAELMAGAQYYLIEHEHPAALLGYMAALECSPMPLSAVDELERVHGPLNALRLHAERDPIHGPEIRQQLERLAPALRNLASINEQRVMDQLRAAPGVIFANQTRH